jgi:transcriptional regulator with XRE-family HTH domain
MATLKVPDLKVPEKVGDLGSYLREQRESARLSLRQLASAAGVSNPYLSQIERGLRRPSAEVLQQIAKGLQISAGALFLRAGLLEEAGGLEVEAAIQSDLRLTARQKRVLLDIYSTFRAENARSSGRTPTATDQDTATDPDGDTAGHDGPSAQVVSLVPDLQAPEPSTSARKRAPRKRVSKRTDTNESTG